MKSQAMAEKAPSNVAFPPEDRINFKEFHCTSCGRFLAMYAIVEGTIIIRCRRCKEDNVLDVHATNVVITDDPLGVLTARPSIDNIPG
jgi:phage FluMu protein Com